MGGPKWSGMSDKSTCQHTHMASFPAVPSPNSPRSGKAVCHGSLVLALPRLPMSLTGHQPCGMAPLSPGPIPISSLALIANHAGFPPSKGQAFSISKTCACSWHRPQVFPGRCCLTTQASGNCCLFREALPHLRSTGACFIFSTLLVNT